MIHHMTQRCALIGICREVEPLLCYGQERCSEVFSQGLVVLVIYVCMHFVLKACRLLTTPVLEVCAWSAVHAHASSVDGPQWPLLDGIGECSPPLAVSCLC